MSGYSGTPLSKKLGIKPGTRVCAPNAPTAYREWISPLPANVTIHGTVARGEFDIVHIFIASRAELENELKKARKRIHDAGAIWVSWPKKSARVPSDVDESCIRALALTTDLVDVKVCAVSEVWSGLKLVVRTHLRR